VVRMWGHVVDIQPEEDGGDESTLSHPSAHATTGGGGRMEGRFERPTPEVGWDSVDYIGREVEEC
jgi:hypothetical protein